MTRLCEDFPDDPGVLAALLLNRVRLERFEAVYLPAGNVHAYLRGLGFEVMANSDNVLRGGLTSKHVDVPELVSVVDFEPLADPVLTATPVADGVSAYETGCEYFAVHRVELDGAERTVDGVGPRDHLLCRRDSRCSGQRIRCDVVRRSVRVRHGTRRTLYLAWFRYGVRRVRALISYGGPGEHGWWR